MAKVALVVGALAACSLVTLGLKEDYIHMARHLGVEKRENGHSRKETDAADYRKGH